MYKLHDGIGHAAAAYRVAAKVTAGKTVLNVIQLTKKYVGEIQGMLAQFEYLAGRRHKSLRHALAQAKQDPTKESLEHLALIRANLNKYITYNQTLAGKITIAHLEEYFKSRCSPSKLPPRLCIKLQTSSGVYTLFRSANNGLIGLGSKVSDVDVALESNTGFYKVFTTGSPYCENNIPKKAATGEYKNPRLNSNSAKNYSPTLLHGLKNLLPLPNPDDNWVRCWNDGGTVNPRDCYKSTLIVPMTLVGQTLLPEFTKNFASNDPLFQNESDANRLERKKLSYGFLCVDSHEVDFFESWDEDYCYIYADLFSLFLIQGYSLREYSLNYYESTKFLQQYPHLFNEENLK